METNEINEILRECEKDRDLLFAKYSYGYIARPRNFESRCNKESFFDPIEELTER